MALSWREVPEAMHCLHCVERHTEALRDSVQVQRGGVRGNTPEGADFFIFFPHKSQTCFLRAFLVQGHFLSGGLIYWRCTILEGGKGFAVQMLPL